MALGKNVKTRREMLGLTQKELAQVIGVSQVAIANLEKRDSKSSRNISALAEALSISVQELETGSANTIEGFENAILINRPVRFIPVISWVQAGEWREAIDIHQPGDADEWVPQICGGPNVFALTVEGESMTSPQGSMPTFPTGISIQVDPDQKDVSNGDCVVARLHGTTDVTFKQFKIEDGRPYLKPLNPNFNNIFAEFSVIGKVVGYGGKI